MSDVQHGRRGGWLVAWILVTVLAATAAFLVGSHVRSPWDEAIANADTAPIVTAVVETRTVSPDEAALLTGEVALGKVTPLTVSGFGDAAVVTKVAVKKGDTLGPGDHVADVIGRPVVAMTLPFPLYRDLRPGDEGADVLAVQEALADLGLLTGDADGDFGPATSTAVRELFNRAGAHPPQADEERTSALAEAEKELAVLLKADERDDGEVASARGAVEESRRAAGTPLPSASIVRVPSSGAQVVDVARVGADLTTGDPLVSLRSGHPTVTVRVPVDRVEELPKHAKVHVSPVAGGSMITDGVVTGVSDFRPGEAGALPGSDVTVRLEASSEFVDGDRVAVTPVEGTAGETGLAVPLVALRDGTAGTYLRRLAPGTNDANDAQRVQVEVGTVAGGYALVSSSDLHEGDRVVVAQP